jgi:serine/threonine protein kinase
MSPEQAQGKTKEIDHRSDIFSFGCILYEAVTGHKAFEGKDAIDALNKIIREPVAPISDFRSDALNHLQTAERLGGVVRSNSFGNHIKFWAILCDEKRRLAIN